MDLAQLEEWSMTAVVTAGIIFGLAFIFYAYDFAVRTAGRASAHTHKSLRIGTSLSWLGFVVIVAAVVLRGVAAQRVPWSNMHEFSITAVAIIAGVYLFVNLWRDVSFTGMFVTGFLVIVLLLATTIWYTAVKPLMPALESAWIVIHVLVAILGTGFFAVGAALSALQLVQARREAKPKDQRRKNAYLDALPSSEKLEQLSFTVIIIGFVLWTFTLIFGAIWAQKAWGRYWGWDVKETWTLIIWVVYAGYLHARATRGWRGTRAAVLAIIGFACVLFNFGVVNTLFKGLHAYSGLG
ncbi:c-type cytochrome biogenesis protein CcsB [Pseudoclavibacter sp. CFCC 11306]|uniref:c-type cytochrome biogenesis protein CcsB n=1 Tax=Pseudoclavibacter sp. CFCC 11306 TaxID=1564493 RepID=UPI00130141BF|nr:c-type cytochrome biogenesis protein CcsB [Pseudoclavibacter sp. CFCC 11306]KAB1657518.1 c-type cytochrome biogenesis protein CcsB [Pseudoclavibacter sp. CFCC 11306]